MRRNLNARIAEQSRSDLKAFNNGKSINWTKIWVH